MRIYKLGLFCVGLLAMLGGNATAGLITFNSDPDGAKPNGFTSVDSPLVHFTDSLGADLQTGYTGSETNGTSALVVYGDDASELIIDFDVLVNSISLDFGNDHPGFVTGGVDRALLTLYLGVTQVAQAFTVVNGNDLMDQSVSYTGVSFNRAVFAYTNPSNVPVGLIEVVDNIAFTQVPEPGSIVALLSLASCGAGAVVLRRRRSKRLAA